MVYLLLITLGIPYRLWPESDWFFFESLYVQFPRHQSVKGQLCCPHFFPYFNPHFFPYFSLQLFPYFSIYYSVQLAYIIWQIIIYMYRTRIMREFICFYLLSMYSILVKSIYNIQNSRPRYSAIHTIFWHRGHSYIFFVHNSWYNPVFFDLLVDPWNNFLVVQTKANDDLGLYQVWNPVDLFFVPYSPFQYLVKVLVLFFLLHPSTLCKLHLIFPPVCIFQYYCKVIVVCSIPPIISCRTE